MNKYIKSFVNVSVLAQHSIYYKQERDDQDIETIMELVCKEKQKKPVYKQTCYGTFKPYCPNCDSELYIIGGMYCPHCGQRIDWEEEEGETE